MELNIEDFKEFLDTLKAYEDAQLDMAIKICINALWIMHNQGNRMATKTLEEVQKHL